jgi:hypothetical protein
LFVDLSGYGVAPTEDGFKKTFVIGKEIAENITKQVTQAYLGLMTISFLVQ